MRFWRLVDADGVSFGTVATGEDLPAGAMEVDRLPQAYEDFIDGQWVRDAARVIDAEHLAQHGRDAIMRAHAIKAVEASLILSGVAFDGLIAAEARAIGKDVIEVARSVAANTALLVEAEVNRRAAKVLAREDQ